MPLNRALSEQLIHSLHDLRAYGEFHRAELYWNVQRLVRTRLRSAALCNVLERRRRLRVFTPTSPEISAGYALPPHAA